MTVNNKPITNDQGKGLTVAADSLDHEDTLYAAIQNVLQHGRDSLYVETADGSSIEILKILPAEELVEPCFHKEKKIIVESRRIGQQVVTEFGGIFIPWEDLKTMFLVVEEDGNTIRFKN